MSGPNSGTNGKYDFLKIALNHQRIILLSLDASYQRPIKIMPLPIEAFAIHGGCNCKAIRYEVSIPPHTERPHTVYKNPGADIGDLRLPAVYLDHCNDCRRATSAVVPMVLVSPTSMVRASLLSHTTEAEYGFDVPHSDREWMQAGEVFDSTNTSVKDSYLKLYKSSQGRCRWFCSRCGTMIAYSIGPGIIPLEWGWPAMLDIWLGTVDRKDLEKDYMKPERMLWCEKGIPWVREMTRSGAGGIPEHPLTKIDKVVGDDIHEDLKELEGIGK